MAVEAGAQAGADPQGEAQGGGEDQGNQQQIAGADDGQKLAGAGADGAPDGGAEGGGEGGGESVDLAAALKAAGFTGADIRAIIESLPEDEQAEVLGEKLTSAEERGRQQGREAREAQRERQSAYRVLAVAGAESKPAIQQFLAREFSEEDEDGNRVLTRKGEQLDQLIENYRLGAVAYAGLEMETDLQQVRDAFKDVLTGLPPEQQRRLNKAQYQQATRGGLAEVLAIVQIGLDVLRTEPKPGKNGQSAAATAELAGRLKELAEKFGKLPPKTPTGRARNVDDERTQIQQEIKALSATDPKFDEKWKDLKAREAALSKG